MIPDSDLDAWQAACDDIPLLKNKYGRVVSDTGDELTPIQVNQLIFVRLVCPRLIASCREQRELLDWAMTEVLAHYTHKKIFYDDPDEPDEWWLPYGAPNNLDDTAASAIRYLDSRGLLERYSEQSNWVRIKERSDAAKTSIMEK